MRKRWSWKSLNLTKVVVSLSKSVELTKNARAVKICCCSYVFRVYYYLYKHDGTIFEINLSCDSFAQHSLIFLVGSSSLFHNQNDSAKLHSVFEIALFAVPTKMALLFIGKAFCCLPSHPKLVYSMWLASLCFVVSLASFLAWISLSVAVVIPRRFFSCENLNCQLLSRCLHTEIKIQNCFLKAQLQYRH